MSADNRIGRNIVEGDSCFLSVAFRTEALTLDLVSHDLRNMIGAKRKIDDPDLRLVSGIEAEFCCLRRSIDKRRIGVLVADEIRFEIFPCRVFDKEADVAVGFGQGKQIISGKLRT